MPIERSQAAELLDALVSLLRVSRTVAHRDAERSVSATPITVLRLVRNQGLRLGDVAGQAQVKPSVASRAVAALEAEGYVTRTPDPDDARACRVTITEAGRQHLDEKEAWVLDVLASTFGDWSTDEAETSVRVLQRMEKSIQDWEKILQDTHHRHRTPQVDDVVGRQSPDHTETSREKTAV